MKSAAEVYVINAVQSRVITGFELVTGPCCGDSATTAKWPDNHDID